MRLLLDTHIFLWLNSDSEQLPPPVFDACANTSNQLFLSLVSTWEIQIKQQLGKLHLGNKLSDLVETQIEQNGLNILPVTLEHIYALNDLPHIHKDPFDRLLISQAEIESMVLVTVDKKIVQYNIETLGDYGVGGQA